PRRPLHRTIDRHRRHRGAERLIRPSLSGGPVAPAPFLLDHHDKPPQRRNRPHVSLIVDLNDNEYRRCVSGTPLTELAPAMLLCDSEIGRMVMRNESEGSAPLPKTSPIASQR